MDPALREFLIVWVIGWNVATLLLVLYGVFLFGIPQKIVNFIIYHARARFFHDKIEEFYFYRPGLFSKRVDDEVFHISIKRISEAQCRNARLRLQFMQRGKQGCNSRSSVHSAAETKGD